MNYDPQYPQVPSDPLGDGDALYDEELSLRRIARALWSYRRIINLALIGVVILATLFAAWAYLLQPVERQASVEFRMVFEGADKGEYPNGIKFSPAEVIGVPVLTTVFEVNKLDRYCTYDEFKNAFFIQESNKEIELLGYEYAARLSDPKLTPVDRARVEEEFLQRREALRVPQYRLTFLSPATGSPIPAELMSKLLSDVLSTWADQAASKRGVLKYQINMLSSNVMPQEILSAEDYLIRLDMLRGKINRVLNNLDELSKLPGASVQRIGDRQVSISEIRANLADVLRYNAEPLIGLIRGTGVSTNRDVLIRYLENRLFQVRIEKEAAQRRHDMLRDSLNMYMQQGRVASSSPGDTSGGAAATSGGAALIPQVGESFIDRLLELTKDTTDLKYRQTLADRIMRTGEESVAYQRDVEYYSSMLDAVRHAPGRDASDEAKRSIEAQLKQLYEATLKAIEEGNTFYEQLSLHNLNPRTNLYTLTGPYSTRTVRAVSAISLGTYVLLAVGIAALLVPVACFVHYYLVDVGILKSRRQRRAEGDAGQAHALQQTRTVSVRGDAAAPVSK